MTTRRAYQPIHHSLIVHPGMLVHVTAQAIHEFNHATREIGDDLYLRPGHLYRITERQASYCKIEEVSTGRSFGWFTIDKLILVVSYKGFTLYGKRAVQWQDYHQTPYTPWTVEIHYPGGHFCEAIYEEAGFWATMHAAANRINTIIESEQ